MTVPSAESSAISANRVKIIDEMPARPSSTRPAIPPPQAANERTVLEAIRVGAPISRAEISRRAESPSRPSARLQSLLEAGLVREVDHDPGGLSHGAVRARARWALVLGLDLGARPPRCDMRPRRCRPRPPGRRAERPRRHRRARWCGGALRRSLVDAAGVSEGVLDGAVVGVPGVVDAYRSRTHDERARPEGMAFGLEAERARAARGGRERHQPRRPRRALARSLAGSTTSSSFRGKGPGAGLVLRGELHRPARRLGGARPRLRRPRVRHRPVRRGPVRARRRSPNRSATRFSCRPTIRPPQFTRHAGDAVARGRERRGAPDRLHLVPVAAVGDVDLVVLEGRNRTNGDLLPSSRALVAGRAALPVRGSRSRASATRKPHRSSVGRPRCPRQRLRQPGRRRRARRSRTSFGSS